MIKDNKIFKIVGDVLITAAIFGLVPAILVGIVTSRSDVLLGIRSFNVVTGSMQPVIPIGSMVFTMDAAGYLKGDVITFKRGDITVTHRIVEESNGQFVTKGDANISIDPQLVSKSDVIGKNFFIAPNVGKFTNFVKTVPGFLIMIVLPTLLFIFFEILNIKKEWEKEIKKKIMSELEGFQVQNRTSF